MIIVLRCRNTKYLQVIIILRCRNTKYIQAEHIHPLIFVVLHIYTLIFVVLTGEEKCKGEEIAVRFNLDVEGHCKS